MDKFVNATRLIGVLDSAIARPRTRDNAKSIDDMWCDMAMQYTKRILEEEMSAGGEFRRVVHAHWVDVGGNSICSACRCRSIEDEEGWFCNEKSPVFCPYCGAVMDEEVK